MRRTNHAIVMSFLVSAGWAATAGANVEKIEWTPTNLASGNQDYFTVPPTANPALFFGQDYGSAVRKVNFNTAPDGSLVEGGDVTTQYASLGVTMNNIRISADIYGGNLYGAGYATEDNVSQVYTFTRPVLAVGIVNTSPDKDRVSFYSGPGGTGTLLLEFSDQEGLPLIFNIDRFLGGRVNGGAAIRFFVMSNQGGDLELDELIFAFAPAIPGDFNGDGLVDAIDIDLLFATQSGAVPTADGLFDVANDAQVVTTPGAAGSDADHWVQVIRETRYGDANLDQSVDFDDLVILAQRYGTQTGATWADASFNGDGTVDFDDLVPLAQNYGFTALADLALLDADPQFAADWQLAVSMVPQPAMLGVLVLGGVPLARRRCQR
jgi:hypothetical protein